MEKVLVCLLAKTRAHELTFPSFKRHVLDELNADLALALTIDAAYDYENPLWQHAKYRWTAPDYDDYGIGYDWIQQGLCQQRNVAPKNWRLLLRLRGPWAGRIHSERPHPSASSILPFCRWLLLRGMVSERVLDQYDRFVISRSDFLWLCPHPPLSILAPEAIWIPDGQHWGGINDRHMIVSRADVVSALNGLEDILLHPDELFDEMKEKMEWNDEGFLAHHFRRTRILRKTQVFPYVMYTARSIWDRSPTYSTGRYDRTVGHFVKYEPEFRDAKAFSTVIGNRSDWERKEWTALDPKEVVFPPTSLSRRIAYFFRGCCAWIISQLVRPRRVYRVVCFLKKAVVRTKLNSVGDSRVGGYTEEWSKERAV